MADNNATTTLYQDVDYIKLSKNSRSYSWDIKIIGTDIGKLEKIDKELRDKFGNELIIGSKKDESD